MRAKFDHNSAVVEQIKELMEQGEIPWTKPWVSQIANQSNGISRRPYTGFNALLLSMVADRKGFKSPYWFTAKKAFELGLKLEKSSKGCRVIGWFPSRKKGESQESSEESSEGKKDFLLTSSWCVFNFDQFTVPNDVSLPKHLTEKPELVVKNFTSVDEAESLILASGAKINRNGSAAYYVPKFDEVTMPRAETFIGTEEYYSTLFHELTHWTGHESRLNRFKTKNCTRFASKEYSKEELTAEMGAVFICSRLGISTDSSIRNSAAYLKGWLKYLTDHPDEFVKACQRAQKACDFVFNSEVKAKVG